MLGGNLSVERSFIYEETNQADRFAYLLAVVFASLIWTYAKRSSQQRKSGNYYAFFNRKKIEKKDQNSVYVDFNKDLHMHFDHVFLFPPYTVEKEQKKVLGQEWKKIQNIGIANRDDINLLIFVQNGKISNTILLPREYKIKMPRPMNKDYEIPSAVVIEKNADK